MGALAGVVSVLVGLPPFAAAPAPGAIPPNAPVTALDPQLGIAQVMLPRQGLAGELLRLRSAPGTRYATVEATGHLADACALAPGQTELAPVWWRSAVHLPARADASGYVVGVVDSGADIERLGPHQTPITGKDFTSGSGDWNNDRLGHGTAVASLIAANRGDVGVTGIAPSADLVVARIAVPQACTGAPLESSMVRALAWLRTQDVQVVNISASVRPSPSIRTEIRAIQLRGALVVAAAGNRSEGDTPSGYPAALPHVIGVGALSGPRALDRDSVRGPLVDLVAPASGLGVVASSALLATASTTITDGGTSFATPLVSGAAALVWAAHQGWSADQVAAALRQGASRLGSPRPNVNTGWGMLNVAASLKEHPTADPDEPNDWVGAALAHAALPVRRSMTLHATLDPGDDPIDAYCVQLRRGQRLTLNWSSKVDGMLVLAEPPGISSGLLDGSLGRAKGAAVSSATGSSGHLTFRATRTGDYLVVLAGETGRGSYSLTLRRP